MGKLKERMPSFSLSHGLDTLPPETVGELDILVKTNCLVSKKRTHGISDQHRPTPESAQHTVSETRSLSRYHVPPSQWSLASQLFSVPNSALNTPRAAEHPRLCKGTSQGDMRSCSGKPAHRPSGLRLFCF